MIRDRIWSNLVNTKFKFFYIGYLLERYQTISLRINIFLAIISLSSVSAWAIWDILPGIWSLLIAGSNILLALKPILAYEKRIKELTQKLAVLEDVQVEYEKLWDNYETRSLDEMIASEKFFDLYDRQIKSLRISGEIVLKEHKKIKAKSNQDTDAYLRSNYNVKPI